MQDVIWVYIITASFLLLHELESAYEREWEILLLPGKITGFLILHIPIFVLLFWSVLELERGTGLGFLMGALFGGAGLLPLLVHRVLVRRKDRFQRFSSSLILYGSALSGVLQLVLTLPAALKWMGGG